jgi:mRNA interferase RelE/StbE
MQLELTKTAQKQLDKLNEPHKGKIIKALFELANDLKKGKRKLINMVGHRVKVGDYRIIYVIDNDCINIIKIGHRKDVYKK